MNEVIKKSHLNSPTFSNSNKLMRLLWLFTYLIFFRFSPVPLFGYRRFILLMFGAKLQSGARIYPSVKIWLPSNLTMKTGSTLGARVNVYNQGRITICENAIISQDVSLCASTHDYNDATHPLLLSPIVIFNDVWVCAEAFIGPGVKLAVGSVVGARAAVVRNTDAWGVYAGNPATRVNDRQRHI